jgi:hypothetical protein
MDVHVHANVGRMDQGDEGVRSFCPGMRSGRKVCALLLVMGLFCVVAVALATPVSAQTTILTVEIKSCDVVIIDSNKPDPPDLEGPNSSLVQARICNTGLVDATNVTINFTWNSTSNSTYIYSHPNERMEKNVGTILANECKDVFFAIQMIRDKNAGGRTRSFTLNVTSDNSNATTTSQTLTLKTAAGQSQDSGVYMGISGNYSTVCQYFKVYFWLNVTRKITEVCFPCVYDPGVFELVNVTVNTSGNLTYELHMTTNAREDYYVTYTFHAIGPGTSAIAPIIQDYKTNYQYNFDATTGNLTVYEELPIINKTVGAPNCTIIPGEEYCVATDTPIIINASGGALVNVSYRVDTGPWNNITSQLPYTFNFTSYGECNHTLDIIAIDNLGHIAYDNETFHVDDTPPIIEKIVGAPNCTVAPDVYCITTSTPIFINVSSGCCPNVTVEELVGSTWTQLAVPGNFTLGPEGVHNLSLRAYDCFGRMVYDNETFYVDETAPVLTKTIIGGPYCELEANESYCVNLSSQINVTASNGGCCPDTNITITYRIWNGTVWTDWQEYTANISFTEECMHYLELNATDCLGNSVLDNETFYVDETAPVINKIVGEPSSKISETEWAVSTSTNITINVTSAGCCPNFTVVYRIWYNGSWSPDWTDISDQLPYTLNFTENCTHNLSIHAFDCLGNLGGDNETFYVNHGLPEVFCISGYKLNESDVGLANWTINVTNSSGVMVGSNVTDATGYWRVCGLSPGNYTVRETPQNGWIAVTPAEGYQNITLNDTDMTNVNFTNREQVVFACISGYKLNESSGLGIAGWKIVVKNSTDAIVATNTTDATGYWQVCGLEPGNYTVCEVLQAGWVAVNPESGCQNVSMGTVNITNLNFTNSECNGSISNFVWLDTNQNGIQDDGEPGIARVTVMLYRHEDENKTWISTRVTDAAGLFSFDKLCAGNYSLQFILPPGFVFTQQGQGNTDEDSNADATGRTVIFTLGDGVVDTTIDVGLYYLPPEEAPAFTPGGLIALVSLLATIAAVTITRRKRR